MLKIVLLFLAFAVVHSITASSRFKEKIHNSLGEKFYQAYYRLAYNLISILTFLPILWEAIQPSSAIWNVGRYTYFTFLLFQVAGVAGAAISLYQVDWRSFIGLKQITSRNQINDNASSDQLVISGMYKWVRHPLYFFSLIAIWFKTLMTLNWLTFCIAATLYFWIGTYFEEKKMLREFGTAYLQYQKKVPRLFPFIKF